VNLNKRDWERIAETLYLLILASTFGAVLVLGIFTAGTVFNSEISFGEELLSHYQEGLLMTTIFVKFHSWLYILIISIVLFESYNYKSMARDNLIIMTSFVVISTSLLFTDYYTPQILELQSIGSEVTGSELFKKVHLGSEIDFKILALALLVLFSRRVWLRMRVS
jgi:hypothetical protein